MSDQRRMDIHDYPAFEVDQHITAPSRYYAGRLGSLFFQTLRDERRILGIRCKTCNRVYWPPRNTCGRCFAQLTEADMLEIGPNGSLETFTVVAQATLVAHSEIVHPQPAPVMYGVIKLDGSDSGMAHLIGEVDVEKLKIGMRMQPVFAETPTANILSIRYFKPAQE